MESLFEQPLHGFRLAVEAPVAFGIGFPAGVHPARA